MTVEEVHSRVDLLNETVDIEIVPMEKDRTNGIGGFDMSTTEYIRKLHGNFMKGREQLFSELHLLGHDVITVPLMVSSSVWEDYGVKRVDGANYIDVVEGKQWKHWWGESENAPIHIYERIGPNFKPPRESNRFFTLLIFSERWDAKNGSIEDLYKALESLAVRFCIIDSELARRLNEDKASKEG